MRPKLHPLIGFFVVALAWGCGDPPQQDRIEKAFTIESELKEEAEALQAKEDAKRRQEAEARKKKEQEITAAIDAVAIQPAELPADLDTACDAVVAAHDEYMRSGSESDALRWSDRRRQKMGDRRAACVTVGNIAVAACEAQALRTAPPVLNELSRLTAARRLMERCHDKFGKT